MTFSTPFKKSVARIHAELQHVRRTKEENRLKSQAEIEHQNEMISIVSAWQDEGIKVEWKSKLKRIQDS